MVAARLKVESRTDTDVSLITAEDLLWLAEEWPGHKSHKPFDPEVFNITLGDSDKAIATLDVAGVNLLAVQALEKRTAALQAENARLREQLTKLEAMVRSLIGAESN